ncbi:MAG: hypothetical protein H6718_21630 [Polyangiaceae bacterium]|nr:hypothetical protein [Polyangiaceae bacterium]
MQQNRFGVGRSASRRRVWGALLVALSLISIGACGGRRGGSTPPPSSAGPNANACGMHLFETPACESALDQGCCAQQQNCAADPNCMRIVQCWNACEARRASEGCNCFNNCAPQGLQTPGLSLFGYVADCSKAIQYPEAIECETGC